MDYQPKKTIVLVGLMGVGKTTVGKKLANAMNLPFVDLDARIEDDQGCSVAQVFDFGGESTFRCIESRVLEQELASGSMVLATGGGTILSKKNRKMIKEKTVSVWLKASLGSLIDRTAQRTNRPLLEGKNHGEVLSALMEVRDPLYAEANFSVETDKGPHYKLIEDMIEKIKEYDV